MHKNIKDKIINDSIYGIISIKEPIIHEIIEHPYFQRLRRISQLGLVNLVYPGANHTRFQHALGTLHLMQKVITHLNTKGNFISKKEAIDLKLAILLHDIGHGPFSHALENVIIDDHSHEKISLMFMQILNKKFKKKLSGCIKIFTNNHKKRFLNQLVSSQLDIDRLDYIKRDSFYTGVVEGNIGSDRLINMLNISDNQLVAEEKAIYSIEKFLISRQFMYWQVYLHKTVVIAEKMLLNFFKRYKYLQKSGNNDNLNNKLKELLSIKLSTENKLKIFTQIDDSDIIQLLKESLSSKDFVLSKLSKMLLNRELLKIEFSDKKFNKGLILNHIKKFKKKYGVNNEISSYFIFTDTISNKLYDEHEKKIEILKKNGDTLNISEISKRIKISMSTNKKKHFLCYVK
ncbi:MAG: phosphohydrolase [Flavobacteriales bacterium]|nr:phosphohydrolase [Flavobacteriales bacterium]